MNYFSCALCINEIIFKLLIFGYVAVKTDLKNKIIINKILRNELGRFVNLYLFAILYFVRHSAFDARLLE